MESASLFSGDCTNLVELLSWTIRFVPMKRPPPFKSSWSSAVICPVVTHAAVWVCAASFWLVYMKIPPCPSNACSCFIQVLGRERGMYSNVNKAVSLSSPCCTLPILHPFMKEAEMLCCSPPAKTASRGWLTSVLVLPCAHRNPCWRDCFLSHRPGFCRQTVWLFCPWSFEEDQSQHHPRCWCFL